MQDARNASVNETAIARNGSLWRASLALYLAWLVALVDAARRVPRGRRDRPGRPSAGEGPPRRWRRRTWRRGASERTNRPPNGAFERFRKTPRDAYEGTHESSRQNDRADAGVDDDPVYRLRRPCPRGGTVKIDLPAVPPDVPDSRDACARRVVERPLAQFGIGNGAATAARPRYGDLPDPFPQGLAKERVVRSAGPAGVAPQSAPSVVARRSRGAATLRSSRLD